LTHDPGSRPPLQDWLLEHQETFSTFMLEEIIQTARCAGYAPEEIDRWFIKKDRRSV
jgi:hypothetical protein